MHRTHNAIPLWTSLVRAQLDAFHCNVFYVYRLTCTHPESPQKYYYGSRSSKVPPEQDCQYWSSSRVVQQAVKKYGELWFKKKMLVTYPTREQALLKEIELHLRFDVKSHPLFFNRVNQTSTKFSFLRTTPCSPEHKEKIRQAIKNITIPEERKKRISQSLEMYWAKNPRIYSLEHRQKISQSLRIRNFQWDAEKKQAMREKLRTHYQQPDVSERCHIRNAKTRALEVTCPWCEKKGSKPAMVLWHFDSCPKKATMDPLEREIMKQTLSDANREYWKTTLLVCPYCKKTGFGPTMYRWHFAHCPQNPENAASSVLVQ